MAKRIYWESIKKWAISIGLVSGIAGFSLLFYYLVAIGSIEVTSYSGDMECAGTPAEPCLAFINFTANEDIFLYPMEYDPWGRDTPFYTDEALDSWKMYRSWGTGWREIKLYETCTATWCGAPPDSPDNKYSFAFREGRNYTIKIEALKTDPTQTIKWGFGPVDPFWYGIGESEADTSATTILLELGTQLNISANLSTSNMVCVDIDHPDYGINYTCDNTSVDFLFNISYFRNNEFNDSTTIKNISWADGGNHTLYLRAHQFDDILNFSINITGYETNDTFPLDVKIYINNTLSNDIGDLFASQASETNFNDSTTAKNITFTGAGTEVEYVALPKLATIDSAYFTLIGRYYTMIIDLVTKIQATYVGNFQNPGHGYDSSFSSAAFLPSGWGPGYFYFNFSVNDSTYFYNFTEGQKVNYTWQASGARAEGNMTQIIYYYNNTASDWQLLYQTTYGGVDEAGCSSSI